MEQLKNAALIESKYSMGMHVVMKTKETNTLVVLMKIAIGVFLLIGLSTVCTAAIHVTKAGWPDPDGSAGKPYHMIEAGIVRAQTAVVNNIVVGPGKYYETFTTDIPCTLEALTGTVTIGKMDYLASTTLEIITLNTHLFGDSPGDSWKDKARAYDIAIKLRDMGAKKPDVVGFQEIWDEDLFFGDDGVTLGIRLRSEYPYGDHGDIGWPGGNSGLALTSLHPIDDFEQRSFGYGTGWDSWANKGWIQATIKKGGFSIWLFNTHTQAGEDNSVIRAAQITELITEIDKCRRNHPDHVVFAFGDFNVYGELGEYWTSLIPMIGIAVGGRDADRNSPRFIDPWTYKRSNDLAWHFDKESKSGRLDYIFYFPSYDGSVEVLPMDVYVLPFRGRWLTEDGLTTNESSDHYSVHGKFKLIRK